ncbi:hypothetical protein NHP190012_08850 [Helicobacter sp. NHP19-012]|uniref:ADP-heptose:LPS heptosyltransferase n=2 Tax=Helicobacteraceae TaxID=72293 RepID=A0ABN6IAV5_9HELI|nr:hypothetical protein NHP190012_08850 [Helicobacter sp. NHP19-012]GMB96021.1 hypothetical protein NHP22001_06100 [Helicobacter sp. NHP22-001]
MVAIKALYPSCKLVVYTNTIGKELYAGYDFIDTLVDMDTLSKEAIQASINSWHFDYFILTQANRWRCKLVNATNAKVVLSLLSLGSIFKPRFRTLFISRNFSPTAQYARMLRLVREIDPKYFDSHFKGIDFTATRLKTLAKHKEKIDAFLAPYGAFSKLVCLNPFSRTCTHNLSLQGWLKLTQKLASLYPQILFILPTYQGNPTPLDFTPTQPNVVVFSNDRDLFNMVELISRLWLLISPSTGNAHIANNLKIPLLGLFSKRDRVLWRGENMDLDKLITLKKSQAKMSEAQEEGVIAQVVLMFKSIFERSNTQ